MLNYPNVKREEVGLWPRDDELDGKIPNIKGIFWQGSDWFNQLTNINKEIEAIRKLELVVCLDATITPSGLWADVLLPIATHFERHDVALPWYKGHYYIHRPKVIEPLGESKTDFQVFTELAYRLEALAPDDTKLKDFGRRYNPRATRDYFRNEVADRVDETYLTAWWKKVQDHQGVTMSWADFKKHGIYKFTFKQPLVAFRDQIDATVAIEYTRLAQWKFDPAVAPVDSPDLASSRGVIDALNREMVTLMAIVSAEP